MIKNKICSIRKIYFCIGICFITIEETAKNADLVGRQGGGVLTVAQATNGVLIKAGTGNITSGTCTLYKVV